MVSAGITWVEEAHHIFFRKVLEKLRLLSVLCHLDSTRIGIIGLLP